MLASNDQIGSVRPDFIAEQMRLVDERIVETPLTAWERLSNIGALRKTFVLLTFAAIWEVYARWLDNELIFPTLSSTLKALMSGVVSGTLIERSATSLSVLLAGYLIGIVGALFLSALAISTRIGSDVLESLTSMLNPLPAIALLPLALIWFGLGANSIIFVIVHSVLWSVALNAHSGFKSVPVALRMVGRNYGLKGLTFVRRILLPAAFPSILAGLKIGWAFAWRTLIAAELVFGVSAGSGGLGWYIFENKNMLEIPEVFAGLLMVVIIGLSVENLIFRTVERATVYRWGMQH